MEDERIEIVQVIGEHEPQSIAIVKSFLKMLAAKGAKTGERWQAQRAGRALRKLAAATGSMTELVDLAFRFEDGGITISPMQIRSEIAAFLNFLEARRPERVLEIGTARGGTFFLLSRAAAEDAQLITIDLPNGPFRPDSHPGRPALVRSLGRAGQKIHVLRGDSQRVATLQRVKELLGGKMLDLLFIDGDHRYQGVKADFASYAPLVRQGGLIALHDIVPGEQKYVGGVPDFWTEVKEGRSVREFVESWTQGGYGIAVLEKDF
jgi:predicted O-methyltransferase YrrM